MTILLVEDEAAIREDEAAYLRRAGYAVVEAADGPTALVAFARTRTDLVVRGGGMLQGRVIEPQLLT